MDRANPAPAAAASRLPETRTPGPGRRPRSPGAGTASRWSGSTGSRSGTGQGGSPRGRQQPLRPPTCLPRTARVPLMTSSPCPPVSPAPPARGTSRRSQYPPPPPPLLVLARAAAGHRHLMPYPAGQVETVALGLPRSGVAHVGVERMPVVGGLRRAIRAGDRGQLAGDARPGGRWSLHRRPVVAHDPLQLDLVAVSGPNQYTVKPFALVSTFAPPIVVVFRAVLETRRRGGSRLGELASWACRIPSMRTRTPQRSGRPRPGQPGQTIGYA